MFDPKTAKRWLSDVHKSQSGQLVQLNARVHDIKPGEVIDSLASIRLPKLFCLESGIQDAELGSRISEVRNLLSKESTGRFSKECRLVLELLDSLQIKGFHLESSEFWEEIASAERDREKEAISGALESLASSAGRQKGCISEVELEKWSETFTSPDMKSQLVELLDRRGILMVPKFDPRLKELLDKSGHLTFATLIVPQIFEKRPDSTFSAFDAKVMGSGKNITVSDVSQAIEYFDQFGSEKLGSKLAAQGLRSLMLSLDLPIRSVLISCEFDRFTRLPTEKAIADATAGRLDLADIKLLTGGAKSGAQAEIDEETIRKQAQQQARKEFFEQSFWPKIEELLDRQQLMQAAALYRKERDAYDLDNPLTDESRSSFSKFARLLKKFASHKEDFERSLKDNNFERCKHIVATVESYCSDTDLRDRLHSRLSSIRSNPNETLQSVGISHLLIRDGGGTSTDGVRIARTIGILSAISAFACLMVLPILAESADAEMGYQASGFSVLKSAVFGLIGIYQTLTIVPYWLVLRKAVNDWKRFAKLEGGVPEGKNTWLILLSPLVGWITVKLFRRYLLRAERPELVEQWNDMLAKGSMEQFESQAIEGSIAGVWYLNEIESVTGKSGIEFECTLQRFGNDAEIVIKRVDANSLLQPGSVLAMDSDGNVIDFMSAMQVQFIQSYINRGK